MRDWLAEVAGPEYVEAILWTLGALAALVVLLLIVRLARGMGGGTFVAGGRNRKTRLAVMDATAVDTHRRLVLVRRDDVEHLLLIGGPSDLVVETGIRLSQRRPAAAPAEIAPEPEGALLRPATDTARPVEPAAPLLAQREAAAAPPARPARPEPVMDAGPAPAAPVPARSMGASGAPARRATDAGAPDARAAPRLPEPRQGSSAFRGVAPASASALPKQPPRPAEPDDMDHALMKELEVSFQDMEPPPPSRGPAPIAASLDDEMTRLLGELSGRKR